MSLVRQNYSEECEAGINRQINMELYASYVYQSLAYHFDRDDVALAGFCEFFRKQSSEEQQHADILMKYQNKRGGRIMLQNIQKPKQDNWGCGLEAMQAALALEKSVNQSLIDLHTVADNANDSHMCDFLEDQFLKEQVDSIKLISDFVTNLKRVGPGMGEYLFDKHTLHHYVNI